MPAPTEQATQDPDDSSTLGPRDGGSSRGDHHGCVLDGYISDEELADDIKVSRRTLGRWDAQRTGPPRVLIGRKPYYSVESVREWIAAQERRPLRRRRSVTASIKVDGGANRRRRQRRCEDLQTIEVEARDDGHEERRT